MLNPLPDAAAVESVTAAPPVFVITTDAVELFPTVTFPKLTLAGVAASAPAARPVPESGMLSGVFDALETRFSAPLTAPALVGA